MIPKRYLVIFGTFLLSMLLYVDRACISPAKGPIFEDLGFNDTQWGWIMGAFSIGYAIFQTPAGLLADRYGPRRLLTSVVAFWSIVTCLTGAAWSFVSMLVARFLFGAGVWRCGPESRTPGLPLVVFPGNVGGTDALAVLIDIWRRKR